MLVSAIMPTRARPQYAAEAVECFLSQTYPDKELVIIDDADDPSFTEPLIAEFLIKGNIQYHRIAKRLTVGAKRNLACSRASGSVLIHWDSDDHSAPQRIKDQVTRLIESNVALTGYRAMRFYHVETGEWWKFEGHTKQILGTSMCYSRKFWHSHGFPDVNVGEDGAVTNRAGRLATADAGEMMWARTHAGCTDSRKSFGKSPEWVRL